MLFPILFLPVLACLSDFAVASPVEKQLARAVQTTAKTTAKLIKVTRKPTSIKKTTKATSTRKTTSTLKATSTLKSTVKSTSAIKSSSSSKSFSSSTTRTSTSSLSSSRSSSSSTSSSSTYIFTPSPWPSSVPTNVPPIGNAYDYGSQWDPQYPNMYRDGGGGVTVGGYNLMTFSDTYTTTGGITGQWTGFWANTDSYAGINASDLTMVRTLGANGKPTSATPMLANETYQGTGGRYCIWPSNSLIPYNMGGKSVAIGVQPLITNLVGGAQIPMYNTLVQVSLTAAGPVTTRLVQSLFYAAEIHYGSFGLLKGPDGYTYLFAEDTTGIKAARVQSTPGESIKNRTLYQYYNNGNWSDTMPAPLDPNSNIWSFSANWFGVIVGPSSGEIFWSPYHNTYVIVFMDGFVDGVFQIVYSLDGQLSNNWSTPIVLYQPPWPGGTWNYAGHAYPGMDPSGKTLVLSYTFGGNFINMVKVTWCNPMEPTCGSSQNGFNQTGTSTRSVTMSTSKPSSSSSSSSPISLSTDISTSTTDTPTITPTSFLTSSTAVVVEPPTSTTDAPVDPPTPSSTGDPVAALVARKVPVPKRNPLTVAEWRALGGPCKLKYSGCNIIPTKIDANSNTVLEAKNLASFVKPVGKHFWGKGSGKGKDAA